MGSHQSYLSSLIVTSLFSLFISFATEANAFELSKKSLSVGFGAPTLLQIQAAFFPREDLQVYAGGGGIAIPASTFGLSTWNAECGMRYFHRGNLFYWGIAIRLFNAGFDSKALALQPDTEEWTLLRMGTLALVPAFGIQIPLKKNRNLSFEIGIQLSLMAYGEVSSSRSARPWSPAPSAPYLQPNPSTNLALQNLARIPFPSISLFRISWEIE